MTSTELKIGLNTSARPSSRVLKPPGGGHTNIFAQPDLEVNAPRPKHNQQNSSNLNACIGSTDPNHKVEKLREEISQTKVEPQQSKVADTDSNASVASKANNGNANGSASARGRVPPGGYSSGGFW